MWCDGSAWRRLASSPGSIRRRRPELCARYTYYTYDPTLSHQARMTAFAHNQLTESKTDLAFLMGMS